MPYTVLYCIMSMQGELDRGEFDCSRIHWPTAAHRQAHPNKIYSVDYCECVWIVPGTMTWENC